MGFTVEDMLVSAKDKYRMQLVAGVNGWANSISWLLMVEDTTITRNFKGKELVVTTGFGFDTTEKLLELVKILDQHHAAGLIVNVGPYISEVPAEVIAEANACDLPIMTVPWDVLMSDMIKDLTVRIFFQSSVDEQISLAFIRAIEHPQPDKEYRDELSSNFDVDGEFQVIAFTTDSLDAMDTRDRRQIGYRLQIYLENISHNAHFFYYNGCFLLVINGMDAEARAEVVRGFASRAKRRMPNETIYIGEGTAVKDISNLHLSYKRALFTVRFTMGRGEVLGRFDELGLNRLFYMVSDPMILKEMGDDVLKPLIDYDRKHESELLQTLENYLKHNGSVSSVAEKMFIHKNTILYRMAKIRELLKADLDDGEERLFYYMAIMIRRGQKILDDKKV